MRKVKIAEVASSRGLVGGPFGSSLVSSDYSQQGIPVIRGTNLSCGRFIGDEFAYVPVEKYERDLQRNTAEPGDIIYTQRGTLGQVAVVPDGSHPNFVVSQSQMRLRVDPTVADPMYVYYASTTPAFLRQVEDRAISTGVPHINLGILGDLTIPVPPLYEQRAIAEVLGALDDKIEANRSLAATADDLAVALFKHHSRDLPLSDLTYADVASVGGGGTPRSKVPEYWGGDVQWLTPTDVTSLPGPYIRQTNRTITEAGLASISSPLYPAGSICMTSRATIGAFAVLGAPMAVNQGFIVVQPHDPSLRYWHFHEMRQRVDEFHDHANGATFMELSRGNFKKLHVRLAEPAAMVEFGRKAESLHNSARSALRENQRLAKVRDTLLPRLMSGQLRVEEAAHLSSRSVHLAKTSSSVPVVPHRVDGGLSETRLSRY